MRYILGFVLYASAVGQQFTGAIPLFNPTRYQSRYDQGTAVNSAIRMVGLGFVATEATSVSAASFYVAARSTANIDLLRAEVVTAEVDSSTQLRPIRAVTANATADTVTRAFQYLANGDVVRFISDNTLPAGITANTSYYVCNLSSTTLQIDDDSGCASVVDITDTGTGNHYMRVWKAEATTFSATPVPASGWIDFSSFSAHTFVAGMRYAVIVMNAEAAPGTDYPTFRRSATDASGGSISPSETGTFEYNFDPSWGHVLAVPGIGRYVTFASGAVEGSPVATGYQNSGEISGTKEAGAYIPALANTTAKLRNVFLNVLKNGSPTADLQIKIYKVGSTTDTLIETLTSYASTAVTTGTAFGSGENMPVALTSALALDGTAAYRIVGYCATCDGSNHYHVVGLDVRNDATARKLVPLSQGGTGIQFTACNASCTTTANWTQTNTGVPLVGMYLDYASPFAACAGGSTTCGVGHAH